MTTLMETEAREAPSAAAAQIAANAALFRTLGERLRAVRPRAVVMCARGSSDHAATYGKYLIEARLGVPVASVGPSVVTMYGSPLDLSGCLFVAVSQSGQSPDIVHLAEAARRGGALTVALVNAQGSPLEAACEHAVPLHAGPERSVAATKSYILSCLALLQLVAAWSGDADLDRAVGEMPGWLRRAAGLDWSPGLGRLVEAGSLYVVGRGLGLGIAQEMALKCKETCRLHAEAFSGAEVAHGPMALVGPGFPVIVVGQEDATAPGLRSVAERMADLGADVLSTDPGAAGATLLPGLAGLPPEAGPLTHLLAFYIAIAGVAKKRGLDPDRPGNLRKVTETL